MPKICAVMSYGKIADEKILCAPTALLREAIIALSKGYTHFVGDLSDIVITIDKRK